MMIALLLSALLAQDDLARTIEKLGADTVDERDAAFRALKERGADALPALKARADHPDAEVASRIKLLVRTIEIRATLTAAFLKAFPSAEDRLAGPDPHAWTELFFDAVRRKLESADLDPLAAEAFRQARPGELRGVAKEIGARNLKSAGPAMLDWMKRVKRGLPAVADALAALGDPAAIPVLLDNPYLADGDMLGSTLGPLAKFGAAAYPEYEKRILDWKLSLTTDRYTALEFSLELLGDNGSEKVDAARLAMIDDLLSRKEDFEKPDQWWKLTVLRAAAALSASRHPEKALETLWSLVRQPTAFRLMLSAQFPAPLIEALWTRLKEQPDLPDESRKKVLEIRQARSPGILAAETTPIGSAPEAHALISTLHGEAAIPYRSRGLARLEAFFKTNSDPPGHFQFAELLVNEGAYAEAEAHLDAALPDLTDALGRPAALFFRAEARLRLGRPAEAEADWKECAAFARANPGTARIKAETVQKWLDAAAAWPRGPEVLYLSGLRLPVRDEKRPEVDLGYREIAGGRAFSAGKDALFAADPFQRETVIVGRPAAAVRDFMPLDRTRVFAALTNETAALYKEGDKEPVWSRSFSLGFESRLSASPDLITAAEEDGTIHAIDPATGKTLWTRKGDGKAWPKSWWRSERGMTLQAPGRVLLPVDRTRFEWIDRATGKSVTTIKLRMGAEKGAVTKDAFFLASAYGQVSAHSIETGAQLWMVDLKRSVDYALQELSVAAAGDGSTLYVATTDRLRALDTEKGTTLWEWRWSPKVPGKSRHEAWPRLLPTADGLFCVVNWEAPVDRGVNSADVCFLTTAGKLVFQHTSPPEAWRSNDYAHDPFVVGRSLALYKHGWEIWELPKK